MSKMIYKKMKTIVYKKDIQISIVMQDIYH
jgi:hypothetical protein